MDSPPKRMTRARAAAKASEPSVKTTKIVTAAARARVTAASSSFSASTKSTAAKRKTRSDDAEEEERQATLAKRPRGRPKKATEEEDAPAASTAASVPARTTRAKISTLSTEEDAVAVKQTRGRPKKAAPSSSEQEESAPEPVKKSTRGRAATATKAAATKKVVKFQEPDKENLGPASQPKEPATAGLRGRPTRRGGATTARSVRTATKTATSANGEKKPLSPKKVTQMPFARDESEDELAMEKVPVKAMMKSPVKPPSKKAEVMALEIEPETTIAVNTAMFDPPEVNSAIFTSPARRPSSPSRDTMKSPAKRIAVPLPGSTLKLSGSDNTGQTSFKSNLLQSAAKRPQSPIKGLTLPSAQKAESTESARKPSMLQSPAKRAMPGLKPLLESRQLELATLNESPAMKPLVAATPTPAIRSSDKLMMEDDTHDNTDDDPFRGPIEGPQFSGRLSAVIPRHADPSLEEKTAVYEEEEEEEVLQLVAETPGLIPADDDDDEEAPAAEVNGLAVFEDKVDESTNTADDGSGEDPMAMDEIVAEMEESTELPPKTPVLLENPVFQLREKDQDPYNEISLIDGADDTLPFERITATPTVMAQKTPKSQPRRSPSKRSRRSTIGFTGLVDQLGSWSAASPIKASPLVSQDDSNEVAQITDAGHDDITENNSNTAQEATPTRNSFFEDEMSVRSEHKTASETLNEVVEDAEEPAFDENIMITDEDMELAQEAKEMSLADAKQDEDDNTRQSFDDSLSEASQEYGDENQIPVDPAMLGTDLHGVITPVRPVMKAFHTTTKIPLKPADESTPSPLKKRSFSASRVAPKRPNRPVRSASVISYSPEKERRRSSRSFTSIPEESETDMGPSTPGKADLWSNIGTPARTPRKDVDPALLGGATVFVDVHTSEGADASGIFVELLTQMGARCVKHWSWNPTSPTNEDGSKVGITHVVFKDGSKRTLEKVREANGVVQCVGVSWVLDCERENEWLEESAYNIDTRNIPRGGARRRKSMEPTALANMNGTLVSSPSKPRRETAGVPTTPNRRQSGIWIHTPSDVGGDEAEDDIEWSKLILTPVPKTPAPETIMRFAADIPSDVDEEDDDDEPMSLTKEDMLTRTCPPKQRFAQLGAGILGKDKDEQVLQRLMAARRKSLQFAPKVGSPLAKMWR